MHEDRATTSSITMTPVKSTQIAEIGYDPANKRLAIRFTGRGALYHYENVTQQQFNQLAAADSKGSWFAQNLKHNAGAHPYTKIESARQDLL